MVNPCSNCKREDCRHAYAGAEYCKYQLPKTQEFNKADHQHPCSECDQQYTCEGGCPENEKQIESLKAENEKLQTELMAHKKSILNYDAKNKKLNKCCNSAIARLEAEVERLKEELLMRDITMLPEKDAELEMAKKQIRLLIEEKDKLIKRLEGGEIE